MKTAVLILYVVALAAAAPKPSNLQFRNLYKEPVKEIKVKPGPRIVGGQEAEPHSIPYQVLLEIYHETAGWYCGGSLISQNYVLTSGFCNHLGLEAHVILGVHNPFKPEDTQVKIVSTHLTIHEDYNGIYTTDIGLIKLPESVKLTDAIQVIPLPSRAEASNYFLGQIARYSGWGLTDDSDTEISHVLNYADAEVISNSECEESYGSLPEFNICTSGDEYAGICGGDSGGPLTYDGKQIGIISWGMRFCIAGYPSVFTRVTSFLDWIEEHSDVQIN